MPPAQPICRHCGKTESELQRELPDPSWDALIKCSHGSVCEYCLPCEYCAEDGPPPYDAATATGMYDRDF